ncbi:MAG: hypothetical protein FJ207_01060 [Gemmatimonadetes bacterium]|nr:hypothetical protein [Gemmatimonadota bacterium]
MRNPRRALLAFICSTLAPLPALGQGVIVDQGQFAVSVGGANIGTEDFSIRRAGLGREDAIFANATVSLRQSGATQEIRPLLRGIPPEGIAIEYQVEVVGSDAFELGLRHTGRRYVATIHSGVGEEQREFAAAPDTRVLESDVAHLYYFLRNAAPGSTTPVIVPRERTRIELTAGTATEEDLHVGTTVVASRRVEFTSGDDRRIVWFDRLGRVLRVEIPATGYVAERTDVLR